MNGYDSKKFPAGQLGAYENVLAPASSRYSRGEYYKERVCLFSQFAGTRADENRYMNTPGSA